MELTAAITFLYLYLAPGEHATPGPHRETRPRTSDRAQYPRPSVWATDAARTEPDVFAIITGSKQTNEGCTVTSTHDGLHTQFSTVLDMSMTGTSACFRARAPAPS